MGAYTLLQDLTVSSNSTSVVLNNFGTITKDDFVKVVATFVNNAADNSDYRLLANNSTNTNYHRQLLVGIGTTVVAVRNNSNRLARILNTAPGQAFAYLKLSENNRLNMFSNFNVVGGSTLENAFDYTTSSGATFTSGITSLTLQAELTNGIGTGSRIQIYKLAAQKVADFTVATNSTQVDIPFPTGTFDPAIDKDSEYLLVSDVVATSAMNMELCVNDDLTGLNYRVQLIAGNGTSASAARFGAPIISSTLTNANSVMHTHIKLSNIGAYTAQTFEIENAGTSSVRINNWFISSLAENITSITKLNIKGAIKAGSRFTLYKLYE